MVATKRVRLLNVDFDAVTMDQLLEMREGSILTVHVDMIAKFQKDRDVWERHKQFDVITCDSQILYFASKLFRLGLPERVSGSDYFPLFYDRYRNDPSVTVFICGAMGDVPERAMINVNKKVGREFVVGAYGPPAGYQNDSGEVDRIIKMINESGATALMVGLGAGTQEKFLFDIRDRLTSVKLLLPLGGTIDYEAGDVKRPPAWITTVGLEWFWRLAREPKRRWKRYLVQQPPVLYHLARQAVGRYRNPWA